MLPPSTSPWSRPRSAASAFLACALTVVGGCGGGEYEVVVRFEPESLARTVEVVEVSLIPDCGSQALGEGALSALSRVEIERRTGSGRLSPAQAGTYGLYVRGWTSCHVVAAGCDEVTVEAGGSGRLVAVARTLAGPGCDPGSSCMGNRCVPLDGGADGGAPPDGAVPDGGPADAGIPDAGVPCSGEAPTCEGDTLVTCEAGYFVRTACELGCAGAPAACARPVPSNVGARVGIGEGTAMVAVGMGGTLVFDTDDGSVTSWPGPPGTGTPTVLRAAGAPREAGGIVFEALSQGTGPELGVFAMGSLDVARSATAIGTGARPLVLLVAAEATIAGVLTVAATTAAPGPGGFPGAPVGGAAGGMGPGGGRPGQGGTGSDDSGGAGGSFGGRGGRGGDATTVPGGTPRPSYGDVTLQPLEAGSGGGGGGAPSAGGGHGGGAVQITAGTRIRVSPR